MKVPSSKSDRRRWQRLPLAIPVFVHGIDAHGQKFVEFATAININAGGVQLAIRRSLASNARISLEIPCSVAPQKLGPRQIRRTLPARILHRSHLEAGNLHLLGLKFSRPLIQNGIKRAKAKTA